MFLRIKNILSALEKQNLDGLIVSLPANITYLTDYPSRDSYLLVSKKENFFFTDSRYLEEAKLSLKGKAALKKINGSVFKSIADTCLKLNLKRVGFEERHLAFAEYQKINEGLAAKAGLVPTHSLVEGLRQIKEPQEIEKIKKAISITKKALEFIKRLIKPGKRELEIVAELEKFIRYQGAANTAFDIIVAAGSNSAFAHHIPTSKKIKNNDVVLVDIGVDYQGYKSDLTRVFILDKINDYPREVYNIVLEANQRAIRLVGPGETIRNIDAASRKFIAQKGYGAYFGHNLGHGVGLEVHEEPHISGHTDEKLEPGMVFTIEPAIYLTAKFGIRIEDMVLVTGKGVEVLSGSIYK